MKIIPFYKLKYKIGLKSELEIENLLLNFLKPEISSYSFLPFSNPDKLYHGQLNTTKHEFTFTRNYGAKYGSNIIYAKGSYRKIENGMEITLTIRPDFAWLALPFLILVVNFIFAHNSMGSFFGFLIAYFLLCIIPINITGQRMKEDLFAKLHRHLIGIEDLTTGILKY